MRSMGARAPIAFVLAAALTGMSITGCASLRSSHPNTGPDQVAAHDHSTPEPFYSNGCSGFREARFFSCCFVHDMAFWAGGTFADRRKADVTLRQCLIDISRDRFTSYVGYALVRLAVIPGEFVDDGWGRAWRGSGRKRYAPLTPGQRAQVDAERHRVCRTLVLNPETGRYRVDDRREIWPNQARQVCNGDPPGGAIGRQ